MLTIKAATEESAHGFVTGLADYQATLRRDADGNYLVEFPLGQSNGEIIALLNALEDYVTHRQQGPAEVGLSGRIYELHPAPSV